jgi:hypothetical protein
MKTNHSLTKMAIKASIKMNEVDLIIGLMSGGGLVGILTKYIQYQHKAHIADLNKTIDQERERSAALLESSQIAAHSLPAIEALLSERIE